MARDAGVHTCTVSDSSGDRGSNEKTMNIIGNFYTFDYVEYGHRMTTYIYSMVLFISYIY